MKKCLIYDNSLRFSRAIYGILILIAFLIQNSWLVLITSILWFLTVFSVKLNVFYQFHVLVLKKLFKEKSEPVQKESGELIFVAGMTSFLLFIGFLFLYFGKFINAAWIFILIIDFLIFLACLAGVCVASLMYAFFKNIFKR